MSHRARPEKRRQEALQRQVTCQARTPEQQLKRLDKRLGKGKGASRERARLALKVEAVKKEEKSCAKTKRSKKG